MSAVEDFIYNLEDQQREIMLALHEIMMGLDLETKIRYRIPFYFRHSWICYHNPIKNNGIECAFLRANELSNEQGILDMKDRVQVGGISLYKPSDIPRDLLMEVLHEALLLDENIPYNVRRKKKK